MDVISNNSGTDTPIFRANLERILKRRAGEIDTAQSRGYAAFKNPSFRGRSFSTDGDSIVYSHSALYRFVDMKKLRYPGTNTQYRRNKVYAFHNRILMGHYNGLMKELIFTAGFEIQENLRSTIDNINNLK